MASPAARWRARRLQGKVERSLSHWPVLPERLPGDLLQIAGHDGDITKTRLEDVSEALVVVTRVLVGEGLTNPVRPDEFGMRVVGTMANALVRHAAEIQRFSRSGRRLGLGERLDYVLTRHSRHRLASWYWATTLLGPRRLGKLLGAGPHLANWLADESLIPTQVGEARDVFASPEFAVYLGTRGPVTPEYVALEAVLSQRGARDFNTGERIATRRMFAPTHPELAVDAHHLVPRRWSRMSELSDELRHRTSGLANLTPLAQATNIRIGNAAPATYIEGFARVDPTGTDEGIDSILVQHLIEPLLLREIADDVVGLDACVERFLDARLTMIAEAFRQLVLAS